MANPSIQTGPRPRLLMLMPAVPMPPDEARRIRGHHLLRLLSRHFDVSLACISDQPSTAAQRAAVEAMTRRLAIQPVSWLISRAMGGAALATGQAITTAAAYRGRLARTLLRWHRDEPFDAVLTCTPDMVLYARRLQRDGGFAGRHVLDLVSVQSVIWQNYASMTNPPMRFAYLAEAALLAEIEAGAHDRFDAVTLASEAEVQAYRGCVADAANLHVVPNGVDLDAFAPLPDADSRTLVFIGRLDDRANQRSLPWFVHGVMPGLRRRVPDARLVLVGRRPSRAIRALGRHAGVSVASDVADVRPYLRDAAALIVPLRLDSGVQNKVLEAMSSARAVVCSPAAVRGLDVRDGEHVLLADEPAAWVEQCQRVLTDAALRRGLAAAARQHVEGHFTWDRCLRPMLALLAGRDMPRKAPDAG